MPIYDVPLPDGQTVRLLGPEGATAEELTQAVNQLAAQSARPVSEETRPDYGFGKTASKAFSRGKKRVASTFGDVIPAMIASSLGFDEYAEEQLKEAETSEQIIREKYRPQFESFKEVSGPIEALKFATETVAEQIPNIATTLVPGAGAGAVATRLGTAKLAASEIAKRQAVAQGVGVYLGSYALNAPEVFQNVYQETGELATGASLIFGAAAASLDAILPAAVLNKITPTQRAAISKAVLKQSGMRPGLTERVFKEGLKAVGAEGLTEGAQEAISISAENFVGGNPQIFQSEDWDRIMESSVRGAIAGGFLGGVAAPFTGPVTEKPVEQPKAEAETTPPATPLDITGEKDVTTTQPEITGEAQPSEDTGAGTTVPIQSELDLAEGTGEPVGAGLGLAPTDVPSDTVGEGVSDTTLVDKNPQELWDNLKTGTPYDTLSGATKDVVDIAAEQDLLDPSTKAGKDSIKKIKTLIKQDKELPQQLEALAQEKPKEEEVATVPPVEPPAEQAPVAFKETAEETWAAMSDIPFKDLNTESKDIVRMAKKDNVLNQDVVDQVEATHAKNKIADKMSEKYKDAEGIETTGAPLGTQESRVEPVDTGNTSELVSGELTQEFGPNVGRMQERGRLQIVNSVEELPDTVKMSETANGAFDPSTQTSYIVANRVPAGQARRVLLHEVGEHYGLEKMVGKDYMAILNRVKSLKSTNKQVKEIYDEVEALYPELTPGSKPFLQEVVAKLGERAPNNTIMRRLIGAVKNFLRRLGLYDVNRFSDIDIQDMILNSLRASLKETTGREQVSAGIKQSRREINTKLGIKDETLDKILTNYGNNADYNLSGGWLTYMAPEDFLKLTTTDFAEIKRIRGEVAQGEGATSVKPLESEGKFDPKYMEVSELLVTDFDTRPPTPEDNVEKRFMTGYAKVVDFVPRTVTVRSHEGRHRAVMAINAGIEEIPVVIKSNDSKLVRPLIDSILMEGQGDNGVVILHGSTMVPTSRNNRLLLETMTKNTDLQFSKNNPPGGYQPLQYSKNFDYADSIVKKMPLPTQDYIEGAWNSITQLPTTIKRAWMGMLGLQAMADLYGGFMPSYNALINKLDERAATVETTRAEVDVLGNLGMNILKGNKRKLIKFNPVTNAITKDANGKVVMADQVTEKTYARDVIDNWEVATYNLSVLDVDPRQQEKYANVPNMEVKKALKDFNALPAELRALSIAYTEKFEEYGNNLIKAFRKYVSDETTTSQQKMSASKLIAEFEKNRLKFYHPLRRDGDYRIEYVDKNDLAMYNEKINVDENLPDAEDIKDAAKAEYDRKKLVERYKTKREYLQALQTIKADGKYELIRADMSPQNQRSTPENASVIAVMDDVLSALKKSKRDPNDSAKVIDETDYAMVTEVQDIFLNLLPTGAIKQQLRRRAGTGGYIQDLVGGFIDLGTRMATQIANMEYVPEVDRILRDISIEAQTANEKISAGSDEGIYKKYKDLTLKQKESLKESITLAANEVNGEKARRFFHNPVAGPISSRFAYLSYMTTIAGNVSSALVNASQLAIIVYPMLAGQYGFTAANKAMGEAFRYYFSGGKDSNRGFLPDHSFGMKNGEINETLPDDIKKLYEMGIKKTVFRRGVGYELTEMRKTDAKDFVGIKAKFDAIMGWMFQNTERMNREVTYLAGYIAATDKAIADAQEKLGRKLTEAETETLKKDNFEVAEKYSRDLTRRSHGTALPEVGPRFFQTGFGKVMFTFKRYGHAMMHLLIKNMYDAYKGENARVRSIARKQILGIYGMSFTFAGLQGVPLYGATQAVAEVLYALLGDDDEPFDFEESTREIFGDIGYRGPLNKLLNLDIASRTGFANLIWREDPRRVSEVGVLQYAAEQTLGPSFSYFLSVNRGLGDMNNGNVYRGLEQMLPAFLRNPMKAVRYGTEGALTRKGAELTELNGLDAFLQVFGFTNEDLSLQYARNQSMKAAERSFNARRSGLLTAHFLARQNGDMEMLREIDSKISDFNRSTLGRSNPITSDTLTRSFRERLRSVEESTNGITLSKRTADVIKKEYGS